MSWVLIVLAAQVEIPEGTTVKAVSLDSDGRTTWVGESREATGRTSDDLTVRVIHSWSR